MSFITVVQAAIDTPPIVSLSGYGSDGYGGGLYGDFSAPVGVSHTFAFSGTNPEGGAITYDVDWGDGSGHSTGTATGTTSYTFSPTHTYAEVGTYTLHAHTTDAQGNGGTLDVIVTVDPAPVALIAAPADGHNFANHTTPVAVDATGSTGESLTYDWNWGDTSTHGTGVTATHTYAASTSRTITLTVTDRNGITSTATAAITFSA